ncbi:MAG: GMP synthase (glutamine-hydrolyzing), partial [Firmicutes bacterium]|nr:GMP synthase (glutamine-hydrolyzing) [Bacillota bacterium]
MDKVLVLDFGGQYDQLIARRVRELGVYSEVKAYNCISPDEIAASGYKAVIFTGGPNSVYLETSPHYDPSLLGMGIPVLGICYGDQLLSWMAGGTVESAGVSSEYGKTELTVDHPGGAAEALFAGVPEVNTVWMSHTDHVGA